MSRSSKVNVMSNISIAAQMTTALAKGNDPVVSRADFKKQLPNISSSVVNKVFDALLAKGINEGKLPRSAEVADLLALAGVDRGAAQAAATKLAANLYGQVDAADTVYKNGKPVLGAEGKRITKGTRVTQSDFDRRLPRIAEEQVGRRDKPRKNGLSSAEVFTPGSPNRTVEGAFELDQMKKRAERALNKAPISFSDVEPSSAS